MPRLGSWKARESFRHRDQRGCLAYKVLQETKPCRGHHASRVLKKSGFAQSPILTQRRRGRRCHRPLPVPRGRERPGASPEPRAVPRPARPGTGTSSPVQRRARLNPGPFPPPAQPHLRQPQQDPGRLDELAAGDAQLGLSVGVQAAAHGRREAQRVLGQQAVLQRNQHARVQPVADQHRAGTRHRSGSRTGRLRTHRAAASRRRRHFVPPPRWLRAPSPSPTARIRPTLIGGARRGRGRWLAEGLWRRTPPGPRAARWRNGRECAQGGAALRALRAGAAPGRGLRGPGTQSLDLNLFVNSVKNQIMCVCLT